MCKDPSLSSLKLKLIWPDDVTLGFVFGVGKKPKSLGCPEKNSKIIRKLHKKPQNTREMAEEEKEVRESKSKSE